MQERAIFHALIPKLLLEVIPEHPTEQNSRRQLRSAVMQGMRGWGKGGTVDLLESIE